MDMTRWRMPKLNPLCGRFWKTRTIHIDTVAQGDTTDVDTLKNACDTQLKRKGIQVGAFVVDSQKAYFKPASREEILAAKKTRRGHTMYLAVNPNAHDDSRLMK